MPDKDPKFNICGERFGRLLAVSHSRNRDGCSQWLCVCDCGIETTVRANFLRSGKTKSCGCLKAERLSNGIAKKHGYYGTRTHNSWESMIQRCVNPMDPSWDRYGGAGVTIDARWMGSFEAFLSDMGERPEGKTLDRFPDPFGDYGPGNCRWATPAEQANNKRNSRTIEHNGARLNGRELAAVTGMKYHTVRQLAFMDGLTVEQILERGKGRSRETTHERKDPS